MTRAQRRVALNRRTTPFKSSSTTPTTNRPASLADVKVEDFDAIFALNVRARAFHRAGGGASADQEPRFPAPIIHHIPSQMGHFGAARRFVYCASSTPSRSSTRAMAIELAPP